MPRPMTIEEDAKAQGGTKGGQSTPKGKPPTGRRYRIISWRVSEITGEEEAVAMTDWGWWVGANPEAAIKRARTKRPDLKTAIANGYPVLPIAEGDFNPLKMTTETVTRESFNKLDLQ